jgi:hypothetical protein
VAKAAALAQLLSTWLWPVAAGSLLVLVIVVQEFFKNRETLYRLVLLTVWFGVTRFLVLRHVVFLRVPWEPGAVTWGLWVIYYSVFMVLVALSARRCYTLWRRSGWVGRALHWAALCLLSYHGVLTIIRPYSVILRK